MQRVPPQVTQVSERVSPDMEKGTSRRNPDDPLLSGRRYRNGLGIRGLQFGIAVGRDHGCLKDRQKRDSFQQEMIGNLQPAFFVEL